MAVVALVTSVVALLVAGSVGLVLLVGGAAAFVGPLDDGGEYTLLGSAAGVVQGQPYPGAALEAEIRRGLENDLSTVDSLQCPETAVVAAGAETVCEGVIDDFDTTVTVTFEDDQGHFEFVQEW